MQPLCWRRWPEAQPHRCSTAVSSMREGQVRAAARCRAVRRGLRLAGGLGWGYGRDIIAEPQPSSGRWCRAKGRWREKEIHGVGLFLGMPELPPASREPGEQQGCHTDPLLLASGDCRLLERAFAGKDRGWRLRGGSWGRERQQSLGDANQPEQTRSHQCPRSPAVPPSSCKSLRGTNTPIPSRRWHLQHLDRVVPLPFTRAIYTSKAQGEKSNNLHTVTESNKHRHRPGRLPEPFCQAGSWASSQSPLPHGAPLTLTTSFFCQTQTEGRARAGSLTLPSISSSLGWLLAPGCGAEPRQGDPSVPPEPSRSLRNPTRH